MDEVSGNILEDLLVMLFANNITIVDECRVGVTLLLSRNDDLEVQLS